MNNKLLRKVSVLLLSLTMVFSTINLSFAEDVVEESKKDTVVTEQVTKDKAESKTETSTPAVKTEEAAEEVVLDQKDEVGAGTVYTQGDQVKHSGTFNNFNNLSKGDILLSGVKLTRNNKKYTCTTLGWTNNNTNYNNNKEATLDAAYIVTSVPSWTSNALGLAKAFKASIVDVDTTYITYVDNNTVKVAVPAAALDAHPGHDGELYNKGVAWGNKNLAEDTDFTINWTKKKFTVKFDMQGHGTAPADQTVAYEEKVTKPTDPTVDDHYRFDGWFEERACTNAWDFDSDTITKATTLYAKWTDTRTVTSITKKAVIGKTSFYSPTNDEIYNAIVKETSDSTLINKDTVTIQYDASGSGNWQAIDYDGSANKTHTFGQDGRTSEKIRISFAETGTAQGCEVEAEIEDSRTELTLATKTTPYAVSLYENEAVSKRTYEAVFNAIVDTEKSVIKAYDKNAFDITFKSAGKDGLSISFSDWVTLNSQSKNITGKYKGHVFGTKSDKKENVKIVFTGDENYLPNTFGGDNGYTLNITTIPETRADSNFIKKSPIGEVTLYKGQDINDAVYEAVYNAIVDKDASTTVPAFSRDSFDIEFDSKYTGAWGKASDEWVSLDDHHHYKFGDLSLDGGKWFGENSTEKVNVIFYGDSNYKPCETGSVDLTVNVLTPSITLPDNIDVSLYNAKNLPGAAGDIDKTIFDAKSNVVAPEGFITGADIKYQYEALVYTSRFNKSEANADANGALADISEIKWVDIGKEPLFEFDLDLFGLRCHSFGHQKPDGDVSDDIEPGNIETVRMVVTNDKFPGIKIVAETQATIEDLRANTAFKNALSNVSISYDATPANEVAAILKAIKDEVSIEVTDADKPAFDPEKFNYDRDISIKLEKSLDAGSTYDVTVYYSGTEADYKPCETTVKVKVTKAKATIDVAQENVAYDGKTHKPIVTTNPAGVDNVAVVVGVNGDAQGYASIIFSDSLKAKMDVLDNPNVAKILETFHIDKKSLGKVLDDLGWDHNIYEMFAKEFKDGKDFSGTKKSINKIVEGLSQPNPLLLGNSLADLLNINTDVIKGIVDYIPSTGGLIIAVDDGPRDAGLYDVTAFTVDSNYTFDIDTDVFVIAQKTEGVTLTFDKDMPKGLLGGNRMTYTQAVAFDYSATLKDEDVALGEKEQSHVHYLYYGIESDGGLEIELGSNPPTDPGLYREVAYIVGGNYFASRATRTYTIERQDVDIEVVDETVMYDGEGHTPQINITTEDHEDESADYVRSHMLVTYTKGLITTTVPPTEAGTYTVTATLALSPYFKAEMAMGTLTIRRQDVDIKVVDTTVTYDGNRHAPQIDITTEDRKEESEDYVRDHMVVTYSQGLKTSLVPPTEAGTYTVTAVFALDPNYKPAISTGTLTIEPKEIELEWTDDLTYNGKNQKPTPSIKDGELVGDDLVGVRALVYGPHKNATVDDETYTAHAYLVGPDRHNYKIKEHTHKYTIKPMPINITINDKTSVYGDEFVELTWEDLENKIVNNDNLGIELVKEDGIDVGTYKIANSEKAELNTNYAITFINEVADEDGNYVEYGTYTITQRDLSFTWKLDGKDITEVVYDGKLHTALATPVNMVAGDEDYIDFSYIDNEKTEVGEYTAIVVPTGSVRKPAEEEAPAVVEEVTGTEEEPIVEPEPAVEPEEPVFTVLDNYKVSDTSFDWKIVEPEEKGVDTGDTNNLIPYGVMAVVSLAGLALLMRRRETNR